MEEDLSNTLIDTTVSVNSVGNECFICYEDMNDADKILILPCCKKELHKACLEKWHEEFEGECKCPHCMSILYTKITQEEQEQIRLIDNNTRSVDANNDSDADNTYKKCCIRCAAIYIAYSGLGALFIYNSTDNN